MKNTFLGHYRPSQSEFDKLWNEGTFIFDTSALLNLYGYPSPLIEAFYRVLDNIKNRIWMPYHVALEFHNNRFSTLRLEKSKLESLSREINNILNNTFNRIQNFKLEDRDIGAKNIRKTIGNARRYLSEIDLKIQKAIQKQQTASFDDTIANKLADFFNGKTGTKIYSQEVLTTLLTDASERYNRRNPPGFKDIEKKDILYDCDVMYEKKYGDLIIWKQILSHAKENQIRKIAFITDDKKDDWWWSEDGNTMGPRPELRQEAHAHSGIETFWMYTFENFMDHAQKYFKESAITDKILTDISTYNLENKNTDTAITINKKNIDSCEKDITLNTLSDIFASNTSDKHDIISKTIKPNYEELLPIANWISTMHDFDKTSIEDGFVTAHRNGEKEIFYRLHLKTSSPNHLISFIPLCTKMAIAYTTINNIRPSQIHIIITLQDNAINMGNINTIMNLTCPKPHKDFSNISTWVGLIIENQFVPITSRSSSIG